MGVGKLYGAVVRKESMDGERGGRMAANVLLLLLLLLSSAALFLSWDSSSGNWHHPNSKLEFQKKPFCFRLLTLE